MAEIIILALLFMLSAVTSAAETSMTTIGRPRIAHLIELKKPWAKILRRLHEDPAKLLTTILITNNIVNISASVLTTTIVTGYFEKMGLGGFGEIVGFTIGVVTLITLVFGEITPKTIAIRNAEAIALWLSPVMAFLEWILTPLAMLLSFVSAPLIYLFGGKLTRQGPFISEEEIKMLLLVGEREGSIEKEDREMISSVFKFGDLTVSQVMTPKEKMACIENDDSVENAIIKIKESGHSRLPVYDQNIDNMVGVVYAKDLLNVEPGEKVNNHLRQALFIPAVKKISDLMDQMQAEYKHLAIVVDEFGHTQGLVTLEDLIEEIVGEIHDEYERRRE